MKQTPNGLGRTRQRAIVFKTIDTAIETTNRCVGLSDVERHRDRGPGDVLLSSGSA